MWSWRGSCLYVLRRPCRLPKLIGFNSYYRPAQVVFAIPNDWQHVVAADVEVDLLPRRPARRVNPLAAVVNGRRSLRARDDVVEVPSVLHIVKCSANVEPRHSLELFEIVL